MRQGILPHTYWANGLRIASEFEFPELQKADFEQFDLYVKRGVVPEKLDDCVYTSRYVQISPDGFLFNVQNTARYLVTNDNLIEIDEHPQSETAAVRIYALSTLFGVILHRRNLLALHASAVNVNGKAVLFSGNSGVGKSTLALGFLKKGYEVINDDISAIQFDADSVPFVYSGYQHLKLWPSSLELYEHSAESLTKLRNSLDKYSFPINRSQQREYPIKAIFMLEACDEEQPRMEMLTTFQKLELLRLNTFRPALVDKLGKRTEHFKLSSTIIGNVPVFKLFRPATMAPESFVDFVERKISQTA
ncbi:hypothetical protein [Polluticoccus soli]|uniref:hypothetical protein n=1 Tax=Polluticoccus soli TaxID=3034150 RepID=UPI0023E1589C|nr:hypothetical protein [Flavipsychrobacter sp. JY13-12]